MENNKNQKAIDLLSDQIINAVKTICSKLEFDKTYTGIISEVKSDGYIVKYNGTEIYIKEKYKSLKKNDVVKFCIPCGNKKRAYIVINENLIERKIGKFYSASLSEDTTIESGNAKAVLSITVPSGVYVISASARFSYDKNGKGIRRMNVSSTKDSSAIHVSQVPSASYSTQLNLSRIANISSTTTFYLNVYQTSGETLTMDKDGLSLRMVRIGDYN